MESDEPEERVGDIMVRAGLLSNEKLAKALDLQARSGGRIGEVLIKLGYATEDDVVLAISTQLRVPFAAVDGRIPSPELSPELRVKFAEDFCRENGIIPLYVADKAVSVVMIDPRNMLLRENIRLLCGYEVHPMIATRAQIFKAIDAFFSAGARDLIHTTLERGVGTRKDHPRAESSSGGRVDLDLAPAKHTGAGAVNYVNAVFKQAISERASDIHFEMFQDRITLRFRIDGDLYERMPPPWPLYAAVVSRIKVISGLNIAEKRLPQDGSMAAKLQDRHIDFRVSILPTVYGENVVLRILDKATTPLDIARVGLDTTQQKDFLEAATRPHGLIFLTGPTGSGKTTTLYALLNRIKSPKIKFLTIEDPVEYRIEDVNQVQVRPDIGLTFASALRSFLRQDPDVILVGEVRDPEVAQTCVRAALTGHLVISTLHTNSALEAISRLVDLGTDPFVVSSVLCLTAAQRLIRVLCPTCKAPARPPREILEAVIRDSLVSPAPDPAQVALYREIGCSSCSFTGFIGRRAIYEVVPIDEELSRLIYAQSSNLAALRTAAARKGLPTLRASGWRNVLSGMTTVEEVLAVTVL